MDFDLTEEQNMLKETVSRWSANNYGTLEKLQAVRSEPLGFSQAKWAELAELGILGLPFSEADGGFGGGAVETLMVAGALGRALAPEPYLASVILGGGAVRLAGNEAQRAVLLPGIADGSVRLAFAHSEIQARYDLSDVATSAKLVDGAYRLNGNKSVVLNADAAKFLVLSARTAGSQRNPEGITLFIVPSDADGISIRSYPTQDGGRASDITLNNLHVPADAVLGTAGNALPIIERVVDGATAALCAEAVELMDALTAITVEYLKTRKQFGVPISSFQALQHKAVDMLVAVEQARSMALYASMMAEAEDPDERRTALSAAKVQINRSARFVGQTAVQLHGGIGMTMEYIGAHYFRRLSMIELMFGDTSYHLRRVTAEGGLNKEA
ncbi:Acyl-CoA dehydrogenase, short-chain specific (plasmid) [Roseomonas mucosa]|uniref:acyl-CoA dehydrogenase family protein n=1 Tax=Roseomonas TaxID=125216 RepID=UPI0009628353|nr:MULTISPECIES: acyl-CoA dehydrogenase family protein [Roseomonas]ATR19009.1 pimeloyl-CoA dehydrogenase small subunit [Roseomonas sp. FDAARGOS_362]USQ73862.1 acyl-CoA dehydrogenase family protein [Roseomonas mucosa]UZO99066.1 Acyl-CoA dehydrogenase, short-chain specific [Roseomonas mucosa]GAV33247.1 acryloyl-CoA reductase [Roseomonas sp. TAS13]